MQTGRHCKLEAIPKYANLKPLRMLLGLSWHANPHDDTLRPGATLTNALRLSEQDVLPVDNLTVTLIIRCSNRHMIGARRQ